MIEVLWVPHDIIRSSIIRLVRFLTSAHSSSCSADALRKRRETAHCSVY